MTDVIAHYGVKGMKWGVRKDRPNRSERRERRRLTKDVAAAQKYVKMRTQMNDANQNIANEAEAEYRKALSKTVLPWNKGKKQKAVSNAGDNLNRAMENLQETRWRMDRALSIGTEKQKALEGYVDALTKKYGQDSVKQLKPKYMNAGENFIINTVKTGPRAENFPVIGNMVSAKKINQWEAQIREELMDKRSKGVQKSKYA